MGSQRYPHGQGGHPIEVLHDLHRRMPQSSSDGRPFERQRRRAQAESEAAGALVAARSPAETAKVLEAAPDAAHPDDAQRAWARLVAETEASAPFELVHITGRHTLLGSLPSRGGRTDPGVWREVEGERRGLWRADGVGRSYDAKRAEYGKEWETGFDVWLDSDGEPWRAGVGAPLLSLAYGEPRAERWLALPAGTPFAAATVRDEGGRRARNPGAEAILRPHEQRHDLCAAVARCLRGL